MKDGGILSHPVKGRRLGRVDKSISLSSLPYKSTGPLPWSQTLEVPDLKLCPSPQAKMPRIYTLFQILLQYLNSLPKRPWASFQGPAEGSFLGSPTARPHCQYVQNLALGMVKEKRWTELGHRSWSIHELAWKVQQGTGTWSGKTPSLQHLLSSTVSIFPLWPTSRYQHKVYWLTKFLEKQNKSFILWDKSRSGKRTRQAGGLHLYPCPGPA